MKKNYEIKTLRGKALLEYKKNLTFLTQEQKDILIGSLLGDASMAKSSNRIKWEQKASQKDYIFHIYHVFEPFILTIPLLRNIKGKNGIRDRQSYWVRSFEHPLFNEYKQLFYKENSYGKQYKVIPHNLLEWLTPRALAYWYMDDGYNNQSGFQIATHCFSYQEHLLLQDIFLTKFNIEITIRLFKTKKALHPSYYIYIPVKSKYIFLDLIKPYILPSFLYKIT